VVDGLYIFDASTTQVLHAHTDVQLRPIYGYWSPDGTRVALLLQTPRGFSLALWPSAERTRPSSVATGVPFFFDWGKDGRSLLVHVGNDAEAPGGHSVSLLDVVTQRRHVLCRTPASFGAPSWSPAGNWLAYGNASDAGGADLMLAHGDGTAPRPLSKVSPRVAFAWSPTRPMLATATTSDDDRELFSRLSLVEVRSGRTTTLARDSIVAFFWSPTGEQILYARRDVQAGNWAWMVVDVRTRKARELARFYPSRPLLMIFQYFDQFALSHKLWSPDGAQFVFPGVLEREAESSEPWVAPRVYVVAADGKTPPHAIARGHTAFWSPK
jgi:TolB protein